MQDMFSISRLAIVRNPISFADFQTGSLNFRQVTACVTLFVFGFLTVFDFRSLSRLFIFKPFSTPTSNCVDISVVVHRRLEQREPTPKSHHRIMIVVDCSAQQEYNDFKFFSSEGRTFLGCCSLLLRLSLSLPDTLVLFNFTKGE